MNRFAMRASLLSTLLAVAFAVVIPAHAANKSAGGDGSGIGGTGNSPSGSGIGGTGTKEQNSPQSMPDIPDRPEVIETPSVEVPDLPAIDSGMSGAPPDSLPEPPPAPSTPAQ